MPGQVLHHLARRIGDPERPRLFVQDSEAELVIRRQDVDGKTAGKTGLQPFLHPFEARGRTVPGNYHLATVVE